MLLLITGCHKAEIIPIKPDLDNTSGGTMKKLLIILGMVVLPFVCYGQQKSDDVTKLDSVVVNAVFAGKSTPVTFTNISEKSLKEAPSSYSLPLVLELQPSVVTTTEGGIGLGYSKISIRGVDASRINVTTNGITLNDAESQEAFWVNLPMMQSFLSGVQLQRGAGTSIGGSPSFGGGINMVTSQAAEKAGGKAEFSIGSYDTYITTIGASTGISPKGWNFDVVYSHSDNGGYIRNAKGKLNSLYTTFGWQGKENSLKFVYIFGDQSTGITWEGITREEMEQDRKYNVSGKYKDAAGNVHYYDNETDNYTQHHAQILYKHLFNQNLSWNTVFNYTHGFGYYENYKEDAKFSKYGLEPQVIKGETYKYSDLIIRQKSRNNLFAGYTSLDYTSKKIDAVAALNLSYYGADHYGNVIWAMYNADVPDNFQYYYNEGTKSEVNLFGKIHYRPLENLTLYGEFQFRHINYSMSGLDKDFVSLKMSKKYDFANPKVGINYNIGNAHKFYASYSLAHREPSRSDIKESIKSQCADDIKAEKLHDVEIGYKFLSSRVSASVNLFFMEYKDQLVATGKLTESGYVIKQNVDDSYRRGVEFAASWQPVNFVKLEGNLTLSKNIIRNATFYQDLYDNEKDWNLVGQKEVTLRKSHLILSPEVVGMAKLTVLPRKDISISLSGKFVGKQYMDNATSPEAKVPAYNKFTLGLSKYFTLKSGSRITLSGVVDNLFNKKYYSYGWYSKYHFVDGPKDLSWEGVYPQAEINFLAKIAFEF